VPSAPRIGPACSRCRQPWDRDGDYRTCPACRRYASRRRPCVPGAACFHADYRARPLPPEPTTAAPGTEAKLAVFAARRAAQLALFHPQDARTQEGLPPRRPKPADHTGHRCSRCRRPWDRRDGRQTCPGCRAELVARYHSRKRGGVA
jgi:hypothetical protein